ncbi:MAG: DUF3343 domain-containing protein, partial [Deltaproteobacteria bacterium]|nr:DUF3343 domain-containing protein [Deltaproteobacteria bacterium]
MTIGTRERPLIRAPTQSVGAIINDAGVVFRLIPAPKALAKLCDLVISVDEAGLAAASAALSAAGFLPR